MALDLYMLGLIVKDMGASLAFYQRLGLAIPEGGEKLSHVEVKMGNGLTFFLDSRPSRWDAQFVRKADPAAAPAESYPSVLEFYLGTQAAVAAKFAEMTSFGYAGFRSPYATSFGMCFAMLRDPDGNTILLSGDLQQPQTEETAHAP
jgi:catechol 2,3-dioxygenase-like lactoylglutathione lyase family enzyme